MTEQPHNPWIITWRNIARYLNVSEKTARNYQKKYNLPVITEFGHFVRVLKVELDEFIIRYNQSAKRAKLDYLEKNKQSDELNSDK